MKKAIADHTDFLIGLFAKYRSKRRGKVERLVLSRVFLVENAFTSNLGPCLGPRPQISIDTGEVPEGNGEPGIILTQNYTAMLREPHMFYQLREMYGALQA